MQSIFFDSSLHEGKNANNKQINTNVLILGLHELSQIRDSHLFSFSILTFASLFRWSSDRQRADSAAEEFFEFAEEAVASKRPAGMRKYMSLSKSRGTVLFPIVLSAVRP